MDIRMWERKLLLSSIQVLCFWISSFPTIQPIGLVRCLEYTAIYMFYLSFFIKLLGANIDERWNHSRGQIWYFRFLKIDFYSKSIGILEKIKLIHIKYLVSTFESGLVICNIIKCSPCSTSALFSHLQWSLKIVLFLFHIIKKLFYYTYNTV